MAFQELIYAYILGGLTLLPLALSCAIFWTAYSSVPLNNQSINKSINHSEDAKINSLHDVVKTRRGWVTVRRSYEEKCFDGSYLTMVRSFLDARSKGPKRVRPKDMWYVVLKGNVLYLYEDEAMNECETAIQVDSHRIIIYPEDLMDGELFTRRNAIVLKPIELNAHNMDSDMGTEIPHKVIEGRLDASTKDIMLPWFLFIRSCVDMEDWYFSLIHASKYSSDISMLEPLLSVFQPLDMLHLVTNLDQQPDVIPMRWLNALLGRLFFSFYRTHFLESFVIGRLMKKLSKVKSPAFLRNINVTQVSVGRTPPAFSKPMLKELTKEGDASLEVFMSYRGEMRITVEAIAFINLGKRFKPYSVKLVLAVILRKLEGNVLIKVKKPPSNRMWYAFTHTPIMELDVEPVVSERQIKWSVILSTIEAKLKEIASHLTKNSLVVQ